jgi:stage V sporulation protein B
LKDIKESFGSGVSYQYISIAAMYISSLFFYFLIAHLLPVNTVGSISLIYGIINIAGMFFLFGFHNGIEHFISFHLARNNFKNIRHIIRTILVFAIISSILSFFIIYLISNYIAVILFHSIKYSIYLKLTGIAVSGFIAMNILSSLLLGLNQFVDYSKGYIIANILIYLIPILMLLIFHKAIYLIAGIFIAYIVDTMVFGVYSLKVYNIIKMKIGNDKIEPFKPILLYSFPLFLSSLMGTGSRYVDRIVVAYFINLKYLGIYNYALILAAISTVLIMPISNLILPRLSSYYAKNDMAGMRNEIKVLLNIESMIFIPAALALAALSRITLFIFAGKSYTEAYIPMIIILFISALFVGSTVLSTGIQGIRKSKIFILSSILSLSSNIILSIILIPLLGITGAAIAYSSMTAVNFTVIYYSARILKVSNYELKTIIKIWISSMIVFGVLFSLQYIFPYSIVFEIIYILIGAIIYISEVKFLKIIGYKEFKMLISFIPERFSILKRFVAYMSSQM